MSETELKTIFRSKTWTVKEQVAAIEQALEDMKQKRKKKKQAKDCADGQHCQRLVTEQELETLLTQGWRVAAVLPSGKIVVSNEH